jgi:EmrB/QacA subfamily drug resistance transporter
MSTLDPAPARLRGNPTATLVAVAFGLFMVGLDATVVSIANPAIAAGLGTTFTQLQWITNVYLLGLAAFLILGGKLGDRFGRRRTYLVGIVAFALTSVAIGVVGSTTGVIVFRALQGASAALLMPQTLALLRATFPRERFGMAVGIWGGVSSVAIAAGPVAGGALVAAFGWESIFYVNAPIALVGVVFAALVLDESTADHPTGRFDVVGVALLALGLGAVLVGIVQSESWGWDSPATIAALVSGVVLVGLFVLAESRVARPLLPLSLFRAPGFAVGGIAIGTNFFTLLGVTFFLTLYLMNLRGFEGVQAGLLLLPLSGVSVVAAPLGAVSVSRAGVRATMATGLGLVAAALLALTTASAGSPYWTLAVPFVVLSLGVGLTMTSAADAIVGSAPVHHAGVAGGFQATMLQLGGALGTAVFAAVVAAGVAGGASGLGLDETEADGLAQGIVPERLVGPEVATAQDAFLSGFHTALLVGATVAAVAAVLALVFLRPSRRPSPAAVLEETVEGAAAHV